MPIPRTVVDPLGSRHERRGMRWLGWEPHLSGRWRLWRTGDRPLEFEGLALTPRFSYDDEVPPLGRFDTIRRQLGVDATDHCSFWLRWPDHGVSREELALTSDGQPVDALVVRAEGGQFVLGWTEEAFGVADPPAGEVHEPYPFPAGNGAEPFRFLAELPTGDGVRFRVEVFDTAAALRTWVESASGWLGTRSTKLVRWAVDVASEFEPALDVAATAERLPTHEDGPTGAGPKLSRCSVCGVSRQLSAFYDDVHRVWLLNDEPWIHIDHGEAAALVPPVGDDVRRQVEILADRLTRVGTAYEWWSVFDLEVEQACCGAHDHRTLARHVVDHRPQTLIELAAASGSWAVSPWVRTPGDDAYGTVHDRLQAELVARAYPIRSNGLSWDDRTYDDPRACASDLLALLEGAGITRPLIVHRAQPAMGEVLETILPAR